MMNSIFRSINEQVLIDRRKEAHEHGLSVKSSTGDHTAEQFLRSIIHMGRTPYRGWYKWHPWAIKYLRKNTYGLRVGTFDVDHETVIHGDTPAQCYELAAEWIENHL